MQPVSLPGENNKNHVSLQECPLTETICAGCIMLAGDTGCPPGLGLVHMKYLAVVTGACCDFIGHVPSLPSWPAQYSDCHLSSASRWDCFSCLTTVCWPAQPTNTRWLSPATSDYEHLELTEKSHNTAGHVCRSTCLLSSV